LGMKAADTGKKLCTFLERKLALFSRYLSLTERMKEALGRKEERHLGGLISKRQGVIHKIEKIDLSMKRSFRAGPDIRHLIPEKYKGYIDGYLTTTKNIMATVEPLDRELAAAIKQDGERIKTDLLNMRKVRQAAKGYGNGIGNVARFLDTRR